MTPVLRSAAVRWTLASRALLLTLALGAVFPGCKRQPHTVKPHISRRQLFLELHRAALAAGGDGIWIKGAGSGAETLPPDGAGKPVEVVTNPPAFESVPRALEREAAGHGVRFNVGHTKAGAADTLEIHFVIGKERLGTWQIRELPKLRRAAIVIDDLGGNEKAAKELLALPYPLTFSVLPNLLHSRETADQAHRAGRVIMLHLPMEPIPRPGFYPTRGEVREGQDRAQVERLVERDLAAVPYVQGVNNHEGSRATEDPQLMADVMQVLRGRHLFFIDSRTTGASVALRAARRAGVPAFYRSVFLDDTPSVPYILGQLRKFREVIDKQGVALAIGHPHSATIRALREFLPKLSEDDIELMPASRLVELPRAAHLSPEREKLEAGKPRHSAAGTETAGTARAGF